MNNTRNNADPITPGELVGWFVAADWLRDLRPVLLIGAGWCVWVAAVRGASWAQPAAVLLIGLSLFDLGAVVRLAWAVGLGWPRSG